MGGFGPYPLVISAYFWLCSQGSLLVGLEGPYKVLKIKTRLAVHKASTVSTCCTIFWSLPGYTSPKSCDILFYIPRWHLLEEACSLLDKTQNSFENLRQFSKVCTLLCSLMSKIWEFQWLHMLSTHCYITGLWCCSWLLLKAPDLISISWCLSNPRVVSLFPPGGWFCRNTS